MFWLLRKKAMPLYMCLVYAHIYLPLYSACLMPGFLLPLYCVPPSLACLLFLLHTCLCLLCDISLLARCCVYCTLCLPFYLLSLSFFYYTHEKAYKFCYAILYGKKHGKTSEHGVTWLCENFRCYRQTASATIVRRKKRA